MDTVNVNNNIHTDCTTTMCCKYLLCHLRQNIFSHKPTQSDFSTANTHKIDMVWLINNYCFVITAYHPTLMRKVDDVLLYGNGSTHKETSIKVSIHQYIFFSTFSPPPQKKNKKNKKTLAFIYTITYSSYAQRDPHILGQHWHISVDSVW